MASSTEDLELLERVFLKIGSTDTDEELETAVNKFLIPVIQKLSSEHESVRKKVMEFLVHVNKRVKRRPNIQLPVEPLIAQYTDPNASTFIVNFAILYIKMGFPRLPVEKQCQLASVLLKALVDKPKQHQDSLLLLLMPVLKHIKVPVDSTLRKETFPFETSPELSKLFSSFIMDVLLLPYVSVTTATELQLTTDSAAPAPPGMSRAGLKRVLVTDGPFSCSDLEEVKMGIVKFISSGVFTENEIVVHLIVAASDTRFSVANFADMELKRIVAVVDWSSLSIANRLFSLYMGSTVVPVDKQQSTALRTPANTRIRAKLIQYLCKLEKDAILFPSCLQVIFDSLYGVNTNQKLKTNVLNFSLMIVRTCDMKLLSKLGGVLYTGLLKLVWNDEEKEELKIQAYSVIGKIVERMPEIVNKSLSELQVFFENLSSNASTELKNSVREALLSMIGAFKIPESTDEETSSRQSMMCALLNFHVTSKTPTVRFVVAKYLANVFHNTYVPARYLLLTLAGDSSSDVEQVAMQALYSKESPENQVLPDFKDMCRYVCEKVTLNKDENTKTVIPFSYEAFTEVLKYLRRCLAASAKVKSTTLLSHPNEFTPLIGRYLKSLHQSEPVLLQSYLSFVDHYINTSLSSYIGVQSLTEVIGTCPDLFANLYVDKMLLLKKLLTKTNEEMREEVAILYGIIASALTESQRDSDLTESIDQFDSKTVENQHGILLAVAAVAERAASLHKTVNNKELFTKIVQLFVKHLSHQQSLLVSASCFAIGHISRVTALPFDDETKRGVMEELFKIVKNAQLSTKIKERALKSLGLLCVGEDFPFTKEILQWFLEFSKESKDIDLHITIGESIVLCLQGTNSIEKRNPWTEEPQPVKTLQVANLEVSQWFVNELIKNSKVPHPNIKQSVAIYLLTIVSKINAQFLEQYLNQLQQVFMDLLSENSDIVQDIASKGLSQVYENSSPSDKKILVDNLLDTLLTGKKQVAQVTEDTKLFEEGALGTAPTGGGLSTYKELCSLASDLNQPDLIYQFMHLANHNFMWNSKKGAAFCFGALASQAESSLEEYLPKIVPRLYRYRFDPTPRIQLSMTNIWNSIVKEHNKTIDKFFDEILEDLVSNLTSNQWRVRISCCVALQDLVTKGGSKNIKDTKPKLSQIYKSLFRVMDDVHEGTRNAATGTVKTLTKVSVRCCDLDQGAVDPEFLQIVLTALLEGIVNNEASVRNICLQTISQLVNVAGKSLKPDLVLLMHKLVEAAGELESLNLSHLSTMCSGNTQAQEVIDSVRASDAKSHYTTQTVAKCVQYLDLEMLEDLVPRIIEVMKSANLGSRVACAHLIVLIAHHFKKSMSAYTGKLLPSLVNGLLDRNSAIRKSYSSTIGQILFTAKESTLEKFFTKLHSWYFEKEDRNVRNTIGHTLHAIGQYNSDVCKEYLNIIIPLIFVAMQQKQIPSEGNNDVKIWEEVWDEIAPGTEVSIRLNCKEICDLVQTGLESASWTMKSQAARSVTTLRTKLGSTIEPVHTRQLVTCLLAAIPGRTFVDKEDLVAALAKISAGLNESEDEELCKSVVEVLLVECNKNDFSYKRHVLSALGTVLHQFQHLDRFQSVYEIVSAVFKKLEQKSDSDDEGNSEERFQKLQDKYKLMQVCYETLGQAWPANVDTQKQYRDVLLDDCLHRLGISPRDIQATIISTLRYLIERLEFTDEQELQIVDDKILKAVQFAFGVTKFTRLRKEALSVVYQLIQKLRTDGFHKEIERIEQILAPNIAELDKDNSPEIRTRLIDVKQLLKPNN